MRSYQQEDEKLVDYGLVTVPQLEGWGPSFRGPVPSRDGHVAFVGAAQTFGRLCDRPFPSLVADWLDVEVLNLGHGGAGPELFLRRDFLAALGGASVVVLQVMSARSQSNRYFHSDIGLMAGRRTSDGKPMVAEELFEELGRYSPAEIPAVVAEFQRAYVESMRNLIRALAPRPVVLLWFSVRPPQNLAITGHEDDVLGTFPHLVNREMIEDIGSLATAYVECVTSVGLPRRIVDTEGRPSSFVLDYRLSDQARYEVSYDSYYPSPEMHVAAARSLCPVVRSLLTEA